MISVCNRSFDMKLIVGLGNPGRIYSGTRHNIGFTCIKTLGRKYRVPLKKERSSFSFVGKGKLGGQDLILAMPITYMNLSGIAVRQLLNIHKIRRESILVVCDDLDLELGRLKIRPTGSSAGHRGIKSIIDYIDGQEFARLRVGIGRPPSKEDTSDFVLSSFTRKEKTELRQTLELASQCCVVWAREGLAKAMNMFNSKKPTLRN